MSSPVQSQTNNEPQITLLHQYIINRYGFAILNETITYRNTNNSPLQIPIIELGMPDIIRSNTVGMSLTSDQFNYTKSDLNDTTIFKIIPRQPNLQPNSVIEVSLRAYIKDIFNKTEKTALIMTTPSLNTKVNTLRLLIILPSSVSLKTAPAGFSSVTNGTMPFYQQTINDLAPSAAIARHFELITNDPGAIKPIDVISIIRTITASQEGVPQISDQFTIKNTGDSQINNLKLTMLSSDITKVTIVPSTQPPLLNPSTVTLPNGVLNLASIVSSGFISPGDTSTFTLLYNIPSKFIRISANEVSLILPFSPPIDAVVGSYTIQASLPEGFVGINSSKVMLKDANSLTPGRVIFEYRPSIAWAAKQAIPLSFIFFAISFVILFVYRSRSVERKEEDGTLSQIVADMIRAFEEKIGLLNHTTEALTSTQLGEMSKRNFDEIREKLDAARSKALQRLNEAKSKSISQRLHDLINKIHDLEREEQIASKDLVNLYEQYYTKRMKEETFKRLLPTYRKRLDKAVNQLSDQLNLAQREAKLV
jgi:hypothetical protein